MNTGQPVAARSTVVKNLRILSLNVCGFISKMQNGVFDEYLSEFDVLCLQETKTSYANLDGTALHDFTALNSDFSEQLLAKHGLFVIVRDNLVGKIILLKGVGVEL